MKIDPKFKYYITISSWISIETRTKTSIRYAKKNDREKRKKERRDIAWEGEIRERDREM